ncbi:hypothetical protein FH972_022665 [Carpinus fangiana]|uniref:Uncharacterized protein n=1 Tax=Carpinus fangiana TaxID=176857 RepID=A0A5N6KTG3_9ROSI|nr:hypothetical protein FH972_022665 [Carpinus fangiana]
MGVVVVDRPRRVDIVTAQVVVAMGWSLVIVLRRLTRHGKKTVEESSRVVGGGEASKLVHFPDAMTWGKLNCQDTWSERPDLAPNLENKAPTKHDRMHCLCQCPVPSGHIARPVSESCISISFLSRGCQRAVHFHHRRMGQQHQISVYMGKDECELEEYMFSAN